MIKYLTQPNNSSCYLQDNSGMYNTHKHIIKQHKASCPTAIITYLDLKSQTDCKIQNKNAITLFRLKHVFQWCSFPTHRDRDVDGQRVAINTDEFQKGVTCRVSSPPQQPKKHKWHNPPVAEDGCCCKCHWKEQPSLQMTPWRNFFSMQLSLSLYIYIYISLYPYPFDQISLQ